MQLLNARLVLLSHQRGAGAKFSLVRAKISFVHAPEPRAMTHRPKWPVFCGAVLLLSLIGPSLWALYAFFGTLVRRLGEGADLALYEFIFTICPAGILGVVEYNNGKLAAFFAIWLGTLILAICGSTISYFAFLISKKLSVSFIAAIVFFTLQISLIEILLGAWPTDFKNLIELTFISAIPLGATIYWFPTVLIARQSRSI